MQDLLDMLSESKGAPSAPPFRPIDRTLCEYDGVEGPHWLSALLDELSLTYSVVEHAAHGETRVLRRHVASLREARRWAAVYGEAQLRAPGHSGLRRRCEAPPPAALTFTTQKQGKFALQEV